LQGHDPAAHARLGGFISEQESLQRSNDMLGQQLSQGAAALHSLGEQRSRLKSARTKVLDVANVMGLSVRQCDIYHTM
jgi:hypothetical protein